MFNNLRAIFLLILASSPLAAMEQSDLLLTFTTEQGVYNHILSSLDPTDLTSFAQASSECRKRVQAFDAKKRLELIGDCADQIIVEPWNCFLSRKYGFLRDVRHVRALSPEEISELKRLDPTADAIPFFGAPNLLLPKVQILRPSPVRLLKAFQQTLGESANQHVLLDLANAIPSLRKNSGRYEEIRSCYSQLTWMIIDILESLKAPKLMYRTPAQMLAVRLAEKAADARFQSESIEDALWELLSSMMSGHLADLEENFKTLVQHELGRIDANRLWELEQVIAKTFPLIKTIYSAFQVCETNQRKQNRENYLGRVAEREEFNDLNDGRWLNRLRKIACVQPCRLAFLQLILFYSDIYGCEPYSPQMPDVTCLMSQDIPVPEMMGIVLPVAITLLQFPTAYLPCFPIEAHISTDPNGVETVEYKPHHMRAKVRLGCNLLVAGFIILPAALEAMRFCGIW